MSDKINRLIQQAHIDKERADRLLEEIKVMDEQIDRLTRKLAEAREALDEIAFPISAMRKRAEAEGNKLDGMMANYLSRDPEYLRGIAVSALKEKP